MEKYTQNWSVSALQVSEEAVPNADIWFRKQRTTQASVSVPPSMYIPKNSANIPKENIESYKNMFVSVFIWRRAALMS